MLLRWLTITLLLALPCAVSAHDVRGTVISLDLGDQVIDAELQLPLQELQSALGVTPTWSGPVPTFATPEQLQAYVRAHFGASTVDGRPFTLVVRDVALQHVDDGKAMVAHVTLTGPNAGSARRFDLRTDLIVHQVVSHNLFVFVRHDAQSGELEHKPQLLGMMHFQNKLLRVDRSDGSLGRALRATFLLGVRHIAEGTDHLMFLLVLLLPASLLAAGGRWRGTASLRVSSLQILKIVSAFTLGHSLTLLIGASGLLTIPTLAVEVAIAISISISALHAIRPLFPGREAWIAGGFGLVHGLAFAGVLEGLTIDRTTLVTSVLGFNLGIEAMQLVVVGVTMPWLVLLSRTTTYPFVRCAGASFAAVAACAWIAERAFSLHTDLTLAIEELAAHGVWIVCALAIVALAASLRRRPMPATR